MALLDDIVGRIGEALERERPALRAGGQTRAGVDPPLAQREVIYQPCVLPTSIALADYKDASSSVNPQGDLLAALRLRELADPVPLAAARYTASQSSIEAVYGQVVKSASVPPGASFLTSMLAQARRKFEVDAYARLGGSGGEWRAVEAVPADWYTDDPDRYTWIEAPLDEAKGAEWVLSLGGEVKIPLTGGSGFTRCRLQYMLVQFRRPWMDFALFQTSGWWLEGQRAGYCSSGLREANDGALPLITTGMVIVRGAQFEGALRPELQSQVEAALGAGQAVQVGPFRLAQANDRVSSVDVVAWRSELVPLSPQTSGPRAGSIRLRNAGAVAVRGVVRWEQNGEQKAECELTVGLSHIFEVPAGAAKVRVQVLVSAVVGWNVIYEASFTEPPNKQLVVRGTLFTARVEEA